MTAAPDVTTPAVVLRLVRHGSLGVARSLGRLGVPVYAVHDDAAAPASSSRYVRRTFVWDLETAPAEETVERLARVARRVGGPPVLIPAGDAMSMLVADHADALREHFLLPAQPPGLARALYSKQGMDELCRRHGVPTPASVFPRSLADVEAFVDDAAMPVALKGIDARRLQRRTGHRILIVRDRDELLRRYTAMEDPADPNILLQEYIPGGAESVWMLNAYVARDGTCGPVFIGQKVRQYPSYGGATSLGVCVPNAEVDALVRRFLADVGYRGIVDLGLRYDARDGLYKMLDVNPRIGTTFRLFVGDGGIDVVRALYLDLTGQPVPGTRHPDGRRWLVEDAEVKWLVREAIAAGRGGGAFPGAGEWLRSYRGVREGAWFARDDPRPFAAMAAAAVASAARFARTRRPGLGET